MVDVIVETLKRVEDNYDIKGNLVSYIKYTNGHINDTYLVKYSNEDEYIFQRINGYVFKDPKKVMKNIKEVTSYWKTVENKSDCNIIDFLNSKGGNNYTFCDNSFWRICPFVKNSVAYETAENLKILRSAGYAFGQFQNILSDFPMDKLYHTIPDFHNTKKRIEDLFRVAALDPVGRTKEVEEDIKFFEENRKIASKLINMQEEGELPLRVTHNDTKYNNILMHKYTCEPICIIDLDTVMPGLSMYDYGDAIRFAANTAEEDETDLSKIGLDMDKYKEFTKGFMSAAKGFLTKNELKTMALGPIAITIELASRFLEDHINGDKYFKIHRENHNLSRARCQIELAKDMINNYDKMHNIVEKYYG
jgi:hypothetical protein